LFGDSAQIENEMDEDSTEIDEDRIRQVLKDYRSGKFSKYDAMDALDLDNVRDLFALAARYGAGPELTRDYFQSDPAAKPAKDLFTEDN
jgi:hypothetical protein